MPDFNDEFPADEPKDLGEEELTEEEIVPSNEDSLLDDEDEEVPLDDEDDE